MVGGLFIRRVKQGAKNCPSKSLFGLQTTAWFTECFTVAVNMRLMKTYMLVIFFFTIPGGDMLNSCGCLSGEGEDWGLLMGNKGYFNTNWNVLFL